MTELINTISSHINQDPFLLFFAGIYMTLGFSCFFARRAWEEFLALFVDNDALSLVMGILILPISLSIIAFYNNWETLGSTILMVAGWLAFLKAVTLLMRPSLIQNFVKKEFVQKWIWLDGVSGIALGAALLLL